MYDNGSELIDYFTPDFSTLDWSPTDTYTNWTEINWDSENIVGGATPFVSQTTDFTCAIVSQEMILHSFGIDVSESELVYEAASNGWLTENGSSPDDVGKLLELHGIPTHTNYGGGLDSLVNELAHGHKVIVGVDSNELWEGVSLLDRIRGFLGWDHNANHAVVISGVDFSNPASPTVIINDPGHPEGGDTTYPLDQFLNAWGDSNYTYTATDIAPDNLASLHTGFNSSTGMYGTVQNWDDLFSRLAFDAGFVIGDVIATGTITVSHSAVMDGIAALDEAQRNGLFQQV